MVYFRGLLTWLAMMAAETVNGMARVLLLEPRLGVNVAKVVAFQIGCIVVLGTAWLMLPWIAPRSTRDRVLIGIGWATLTIAFEFAIGTARGLPIADIVADYDLARGRLMALGMLVLIAAPWVRRTAPPSPL